MGSIKVSSARLSLYDDGSGMPIEMGSITVTNNCTEGITNLDIRLYVGERTYRLSPMNDVQIAPKASLAVGLRSSMSVPRIEGITREIIVRARVGNPPSVVMDSATVP
jgi:hypothetical protein